MKRSGTKLDSSALLAGTIKLLDAEVKQQTEFTANAVRECTRLRGIIERAATAFFADGSDEQAALRMHVILREANKCIDGSGARARV